MTSKAHGCSDTFFTRHLEIYQTKQKSLDFSVETSLVLISTIIKLWLQPFGLHTRSLTIASSAISFRLPPDSISAAASSFPLPSRLRLTVASPVHPFRFRFLGFSPFFPTRFPMSSFPVLRTRLPVCFLSPFPDSLPQLVLRCLPCAFALGSGYSASEPLLIGDILFAFRLNDVILLYHHVLFSLSTTFSNFLKFSILLF